MLQKWGNVNPKATPMHVPLLLIMCTRLLHDLHCLQPLQAIWSPESINFLPCQGQTSLGAKQKKKWCQLINLKPILVLWIYNWSCSFTKSQRNPCFFAKKIWLEQLITCNLWGFNLWVQNCSVQRNMIFSFCVWDFIHYVLKVS